MRLWNAIKTFWASYRFRFVPWVAMNLKRRNPRVVSQGTDKVVPDTVVLQKLHQLFGALHSCSDSVAVPVMPLNVMFKVFGFSVEPKKSNLRHGGTGVFLVQGKAPAGSVVALYPGTIYRVMEPLLLPSIANTFIFRCIDGMHIDGKDRGISRSIYKSCVYRDLRWPFFPADLSWLKKVGNRDAYRLANPLNCGQYVNNASADFPCNVAYQECDLPLDEFPIELRRFLPNIYYSPSSGERTDQRQVLRIVALIATRDINSNTELFSTYYTVVSAK